MTKSIISDLLNVIDDSIDAIAFDLDGTLYDEFDFIKQVYLPISKILSDIDNKTIYNELCSLWKEHGSSANVFQMAYTNILHKDIDATKLEKCIETYRNFDFHISLSPHSILFLDLLNNYQKVIITDGTPSLQKRKIKSLNLGKWFEERNIFITGSFGNKYYKPNPYVGELVKKSLKTDKILYFGDRDIDEKFSDNVGFKFVKVKNMVIE